MLAPMAELSHRALRELIEGASLPPGSSRSASSATPLSGAYEILYYTEMISAPGLLAGGPLEKWYLDSGPCPQKLVYQLLGADTDQLVKAAALLDSRDCLGIDINMGCAAPIITKTGAGVRWMEDINKAGRLIELIRRVTKKRLSVKIRLGPKPEKLRTAARNPGCPEGTMLDETVWTALLAFCRRIEAAGADAITLHPRMAAEKFKRRARWEYVEALRNELHIPVAGNGDINSAEELVQKAAAGPVMAGRLLVREPWAFAAALKISAGSYGTSGPGGTSPAKVPGQFLEETALRFLDLLARYQPPEFHLSRARRFFQYYCDNFTWAEYLRNQINREGTPVSAKAGNLSTKVGNLSCMGRVISDYCRNYL